MYNIVQEVVKLIIISHLFPSVNNIRRDLDKIVNEGVSSNLSTPQIIESFYINEQNENLRFDIIERKYQVKEAIKGINFHYAQ